MLGSHDSMTYLPARYRIFELFAFLWRTQTKNLQTQKFAGVGYFDIRVRRTKKGWRLCHGLVDLNRYFGQLEVLVEWVSCMAFNPNVRGVPFIRLILERGDSKEFEQLAPRLQEQYPYLTFIGIKKGWKVLLDRDPVMEDLTFTPWLSGLSLWDNVKRLWRMVRGGEPLTIKGHAAKVRETSRLITPHEGKVLFIDMVAE